MFDVMLRRKNEVMLSELPAPEAREPQIMSDGELFSRIPEDAKNLIFAATVAKNMEALGYTPSKELFDKMSGDRNVSMQVSDYVIPKLRELKGADVEYDPMYPNFPEQVMNMSKVELYVNALVHYWSSGILVPEYEKADRSELNEAVKLKTISLGSMDSCKKLFSNMLNSAVPFSQQDKEDVSTLSQKINIKSVMPSFIVNRENMAVLANMLIDAEGSRAIRLFANQIKSATDVLRIMNVRHGNGDATLSEPFAGLKKVSRPERKMYLELLDKKAHSLAEDMKINKSLWIKVGQTLHPGEFKDVYPVAFDAFAHMRDKSLLKEVHTFNAVTEKAMKDTGSKEFEKAMTEKPGVFARNLDRLVRNADDPEPIINLWTKLAPKVAPNLLWQVYSHFDRKIREADDENKMRIFTIMGKVSATKVMEDKTTPIPVATCATIKQATEDALKEVYKNKPAMGKVYVDPEVARCKVPNDTRDASKGSVPMAKGSRLPLGDNANVVRGFVWWTNPKMETSKIYRENRLDIDLSCVMLDKNLSHIGDVAYYNLSMNDMAAHSGDIVNGGDFEGKGAAEFVDIDLNKAKKAGVAYFAFSVNAFTNQHFANLEHVKFGFMEREKIKDGEIFEPSTVQQCIKLDAPSTSATTCLFDVESRDMIWVDAVGQDGFRSYAVANNAVENIRGTTMACYKALHMEKPDIYDVIRINAEARGGELVDSKDKADIVFALNEGIKPTDLDYFAGNLIPADVSSAYAEKVPEAKEEDIQEVSEENISDDER